MKIKLLVFIAAAITFQVQVQAQDNDERYNEEKYYFVKGKDTVFCKELSYRTTAQGYLKELHYVDKNGKKVDLEGKKNIPDISTFYIGYTIIDKTPLKAGKPDGYIRYTERAVDGKIKVYWADQNHDRDGHAMGIKRYYVKMPDGTWYKINSSDFKNYIKPYLMKCKAFTDEYTGDYSTKEGPFKQMITLYNSVCK